MSWNTTVMLGFCFYSTNERMSYLLSCCYAVHVQLAAFVELNTRKDLTVHFLLFFPVRWWHCVESIPSVLCVVGEHAVDVLSFNPSVLVKE